MEKRTIEVYTFAELKPEVQQEVIERTREDYTNLDYLPEYLNGQLSEKLEKMKIKEIPIPITTKFMITILPDNE